MLELIAALTAWLYALADLTFSLALFSFFIWAIYTFIKWRWKARKARKSQRSRIWWE